MLWGPRLQCECIYVGSILYGVDHILIVLIIRLYDRGVCGFNRLSLLICEAASM